jgi:hypothetical protein
MFYRVFGFLAVSLHAACRMGMRGLKTSKTPNPKTNNQHQLTPMTSLKNEKRKPTKDRQNKGRRVSYSVYWVPGRWVLLSHIAYAATVAQELQQKE